MNTDFRNFYKIGFFLLLVLNLVTIISSPVLAKSLSYKMSDLALYNKAFNYSRGSSTRDHILALMYLYAYKFRDPSDYVNNIKGHRNYIDDFVQDQYNEATESDRLYNTVLNNMKSCGCYPCRSCKKISNSRAMTSPNYDYPIVLEPAPSMAIVCENTNYEGTCQLLSVGRYDHPQNFGLGNDTISSVMVGSGVKLTLCAHGKMTSPCYTIYNDDAYLYNKYFVSGNQKFPVNNNTTSLEVSYR